MNFDPGWKPRSLANQWSMLEVHTEVVKEDVDRTKEVIAGRTEVYTDGMHYLDQLEVGLFDLIVRLASVTVNHSSKDSGKAFCGVRHCELDSDYTKLMGHLILQFRRSCLEKYEALRRKDMAGAGQNA